MAEIDSIKIKRGNKSNLPTLSDGELALVEDEQRLYVGSVNLNIPIPNANDLNTMQGNIDSATSIANESLINSNQAIVNSNNAINAVNESLTNSSNAISIANDSLNKSIINQNQIANIVAHNGDGTKDTEVVDSRTDSNSNVYGSMGDHIRNLDTIFDTLRNKITFTATSDNTSTIPISVSGIDLTKCNFDIRCRGITLEDDNYTIDTTNRNINLTDWSINTGDKIIYRIFFSGAF